MKKFSKLIAFGLLAAMSITTFAGCGSQDKKGNNANGTGDSEDKVYRIGICQQLEHEALDNATEGFKQALIDKLGEDKVKFDVQNAQGEEANCATIAAGFVSDNVDLIMANATSALQASSAATADIPVLGTSVTDYATVLDIDNWNGTTGTNVTGTSDLAPLNQQADMIKELVPGVKQVGLLYCSSEANSAYQIEKMSEYLDTLGVAYKSYSAADSNEIQPVVTKAVSECDVLYIPTDNTMASNTEIIDNIASPAKVAIICGEKGLAEGCGLATLSIDYYDLGYATGEMAYEILVNGKEPGNMEIQTAKNVKKLFIESRAKALNIIMPEGYEALVVE